MGAAAIGKFGAGVWWTVFPVMVPSTVAASHCLFTRPRQVAESLAPMAAFLLHLVCFNAPNIPLPTNQAIVYSPFGRFRRIKSDPQ